MKYNNYGRLHCTIPLMTTLQHTFNEYPVVVPKPGQPFSECWVLQPKNLRKDNNRIITGVWLAVWFSLQAAVGFLDEVVGVHVQSAGLVIDRPLSSGEQSFDMNKEVWPLGEPVPKLESATQISGQ